MPVINIVGLEPALQSEVVSGILNVTGRDVVFTYTVSSGPCPVCGGGDPFCPTCHGEPAVEVMATKTLTAAVRWKWADMKMYTPLGQFVQGDCVLVIYSPAQELDDLLFRTRSVTVDSRSCVVDSWYYRGAPINRVYVVLKEDESLTGHRVG